MHVPNRQMDRQMDTQTNIMAISRRFILTNTLRANKWQDYDICKVKVQLTQ